MSIFRAPLPPRAPVFLKKVGRPKGYIPHPNQLRSLKAEGPPEGAVLNPYGKCGNTQRGRYRATYFKRTLKPAFREMEMKRNLKRKRILLKEKRALALETHELQQLARENANLAMQTLIEICGNPRENASSRIAASAEIFNRAYGKASQTSITASVTNGKTSDLNATELDKRIGQALKRVEDLTNRAPKKGTSEERPSHLRELN